MRTVLLLIFLAACNCGPLSVHPSGYASNGARITAESSMRIVITCMGTPMGVGSAVAVSPRHALTARHVVEAGDSGACVGIQFYGILPDGRVVEMAEDKRSDTVDVARLVVVGTGEPFAVYAELGGDVEIGEEVCSYTGGGPDNRDEIINSFVTGDLSPKKSWWNEAFVYKCGEAGPVRSDYLVSAGLRTVPGNSGSGVFDRNGRLAGIMVQWPGMPFGYEQFGRAIPAEAFADLMPKHFALDLMD